MKFVRDNKKPMIIALVQWFLTTVFQVDRLFFSYDCETVYLLVTKFLYFCLLFVVWCFVLNVYKKIKGKDTHYCRGFKVFITYFIVMMLLLLLLWPGTWAWDDLGTLNAISSYGGWASWQNIITGVYQDVLLQVLPFPGGIILLQNIIIALCVAFSVTKLESIFEIKRLKHNGLDVFVRILPFLLPPVLMYQFSGYRMGLYVYLELVMLVMLISAGKDKKEWDWKWMLLFSFLCVIVSSWRTESFFYIPAVCILIAFNKRNVISRKKKIVCIIILITGFVGVNQFQNRALGNSNYGVISLMRPCVELVRAADYQEDKELLDDIDKIASLEVIHNNPTADGEDLYWSFGVVRNGYTNEDYSSFLKAFVKLSLKYPKIVIAERWDLFIRGSGITGKTATNVERASKLFDIESVNYHAEAAFQKGWVANSPVFKNIRKETIEILGMTLNDSALMEAFRRVIWNAIIPILILIYAWIKLLIKKKWYLLGICTAVLIRVPVVILTEPSGWIMYLLSFYFLGYVYLVYKILIYWSNKKREKEIVV